MITPLTNKELKHLLDFIGYGRLNAKVWFLGMEEAGGGEANIRARLKFGRVEDCAHAHINILNIKKHHEEKCLIQRTWRGMCYIMLKLEGRTPDRESIREYQANYLGRFHGSTLLCELMPIPKPSMKQWGYEKLIPQFSSSNVYYENVLPKRVSILKKLLRKHRPKIVIGYGKSYKEKYKNLFDNLEFSQSGQFEIARDRNIIVILTDHFAARTMNNKFSDVVDLVNGNFKKKITI